MWEKNEMWDRTDILQCYALILSPLLPHYTKSVYSAACLFDRFLWLSCTPLLFLCVPFALSRLLCELVRMWGSI